MHNSIHVLYYFVQNNFNFLTFWEIMRLNKMK